MATEIFNTMERIATLRPISFQRIASVEMQGTKKLMNTVKIINCGLVITDIRP